MTNERKLKAAYKPEALHELRSNLYNIIANSLEQQKPVYISCLNCINFRETKEECGLAKQRPPARIIAYGCKMWEDVDLIPF